MTASTQNKPRIARRARWLATGVSLVALGCGSNADTSYPTYASNSTTGASGSAGRSSSADSGPSETSTHSTDSSATEVDGDESETDAGPFTAARCDPSTSWAPLGRLGPMSSDDFARFGGISADELTIAWTGAGGDVYVADRPSVREDFGSPIKVNAGSDALAVDRAALAPTGTSAVAVRADRGGLIGFERPARGAPWTMSSGLEFTQMNAVFEAGSEVSEPILGADKRSMFFLLSRHDLPPVLYETGWDPSRGSWAHPSRVPNNELKSADGTHRRRPTGASADGRTLFFLDEVSGLERAGWRASPNKPFKAFEDLGPFAEAAPSAPCDTLYYQSQDTGGRGVFSAE